MLATLMLAAGANIKNEGLVAAGALLVSATVVLAAQRSPGVGGGGGRRREEVPGDGSRAAFKVQLAEDPGLARLAR